MSERQLLNLKRHRVLSSLSLTDNNGACYFDQAWLGKPPTFSGRNKNVTRAKRPALQVSFY